jgi:hypothetical protein
MLAVSMKVHAHMVPADAKDSSEIQMSVNIVAGW